MIVRDIEVDLQRKLFQGKVITLIGARQTGKTTLLKRLFEAYREDALWLNADEYDIQERFKQPTSTQLKAMIGNKKLVIIDEAQQITNIGLALKLLIDNYPEIQVIATGSSAFELKNKTNEPLTGRKFEFHLFPISYGEMVKYTNDLVEQRMLNHRLVFGMYPEVIMHPGNEIERLKSLSDSFLYKDLLMLEDIKKPEKLVKLLQALAYQVGNEVSYNEIGNLIGLNSKTVESYIQLLEKSFVIFRLSSFSRNLRNELKASKKIYFYDNGIRNALIANFNQVELRTDVGALWENFMVSERMKYLQYSQQWVNSWYWRTKEQKEIDYIEEQDGVLTAFEFKWKPDAKYKMPKLFLETYTGSEFKIIHRDNFEDFLM